MTTRRSLLVCLGSIPLAVALPLRAQAPKAVPVIGFLSGRSASESGYLVSAFRAGLREAGFVEGRNVAINFIWADGKYDRLPAQAAGLVRAQVALLVAVGAVPAIRAAKSATSSIPIVFITGDDAVRLGLVASMNRPGGNLTGVTILGTQLESKRLATLHELLPRKTAFAILVNPTTPSSEFQVKEAEQAARKLGRTLHVARASTMAEIDEAFAALAQRGIGGLLLGSDPFMASRRDQLVSLAARHAIPTIYWSRELVAAGGLMSYGANGADSYRQAGLYAGRILKGEKPADLPVVQPNRLELLVNLKAARALGLNIPPTLLVAADEVIE